MNYGFFSHNPTDSIYDAKEHLNRESSSEKNNRRFERILYMPLQRQES